MELTLKTLFVHYARKGRNSAQRPLRTRSQGFEARLLVMGLPSRPQRQQKKEFSETYCNIYQTDIYLEGMEKRGSKKRPNQSMFAVLGLLSLGGMTGYELRKLSEQSIQHFWRESFGQIYPSLKQLEARGWATRKTETSGVPGRPARQVYALTAAGSEALKAWVATLAKPEVPRNELLLKVFFGRNVPAEVNLRQIAEHRKKFVEEFNGYAAIEERIQSEYRNHPDMPYWLLTLSYGRRYTEAEIAWCDEAMEVMQVLAAPSVANGSKGKRRRTEPETIQRGEKS
jgi:DNA-binding PadR family transcriptional regulator